MFSVRQNSDLIAAMTTIIFLWPILLHSWHEIFMPCMHLYS